MIVLIQFDVLQRNEYNRQTPGLKGGSDDGKAVCNVWSHSDFVTVDADAVDAVDVDAVLVVAPANLPSRHLIT